MDPDDSDPEAAAMAAALGFSTFGSQGPSKKRKYNPKTDAMVEGDDLAALDRGGKKGQGSGGNQVPLGRQRVFGAPAPIVQNGEEIELDDDEDAEDNVPNYARASKVPPVLEREIERGGVPIVGLGNGEEIDLDDSDEGEDGPQYIDTSKPPPAVVAEQDEEARKAQERIDAILASSMGGPSGSNGLPTRMAELPLPTEGAAPGTEGKWKGKNKAKDAVTGRGIGYLLAQLQQPVTLPPKPPASTASPADSAVHAVLEMVGAPGAGPYAGAVGGSYAGSVAGSEMSGRNGGRGGPRGQRNEDWYIGYYDPSFNENPWKKLEEEERLEARGSWVERERGQRA
jgi:hypothetical protein